MSSRAPTVFTPPHPCVTPHYTSTIVLCVSPSVALAASPPLSLRDIRRTHFSVRSIVWEKYSRSLLPCPVENVRVSHWVTVHETVVIYCNSNRCFRPTRDRPAVVQFRPSPHPPLHPFS